MTNYREPHVEYEQIIVNQTASVFLPSLPACIVGPIYEMIDDDNLGSYDGTAVILPYTTPYAVDYRLSASLDDEIAYPLTIKFDDATSLFGSYSLGAINEGVSIYEFNAGSGSPFDFVMDSNSEYYVYMLTGDTEHLMADGVVELVAGTTYKISFTTPNASSDDVGRLLDVTDNASVAWSGLVVTAVSSDGLEIEFTEATNTIATGPCTLVSVKNAGSVLTTAEKAGRRIRSIQSSVKATLYTGTADTNFTNVAYEVRRIGDVSINVDEFADLGISADDSGISLPAGLQDQDGNYITDGDVLMTCRALRTDLFETINYYTSDTLDDSFTVNKYNTAIWGVYNALLNSNDRKVYVTGLDERHYDAADRATCYSAAFAFIADYRTYGIVPMTMMTSVHALLDTHVTGSSDAEHDKWRIGLDSRKLVTESELLSNTTGHSLVGTEHEGISGSSIVDAAGTFLTVGAKINDEINVKGWGLIIPTNVYDTGTLGAPPAITLISGTWGTTDQVTLSIAGFSVTNHENYIGKTLKFIDTSDSALETSSDTGIFTDSSRSGNSISTNQTYSDLGYRIVNLVDNAGNLEITIDVRNSSLSLDPFPANTLVRLAIFDGPLTLTQESTLLSGSHVITAVNSEQQMDLSFLSGWYGVYSDLEYELMRPFTKSEQAQYIGSYAGGYANRRMNFMWPDRYEDEFGDVLWAYFIAAAEAGWISGNVPQRGITNATLKGFYRLLYSNKYFSNTQFNEMIDNGGVTIWTQDVDGEPIKCRHQLTSDTTGILYQENSITRCADTAAYLTVEMIRSLIGQWNITPELFTEIKFKLSGVEQLLTETSRVSKFGSILKEFKPISVTEDLTSQDTIDVVIDNVTNKPVNRIRVKARIS